MKKKKILFVCKHNLFRSQVGEKFFNKLNKNKNYVAESAGVIKWNPKDLKGDKAYAAEKKVAAEKGIKMEKNSQGLSSSLLKSTDILVIVADDVSPEIFRTDKAFNGKIKIWKTKDVKARYRDKEKVASNTVNFIEKKVRNLVKTLK